MDNPNWTNMFFYSTVYVTAQNDCCYALTTSGDIYNYLFNTGNWFQITTPTSNPIVSISAGTDGSLTILDDQDNAYLLTNGFWTNVHNSALNICPGDSYHYIVTDTSCGITKYEYGSTTAISGGPTKLSTTEGLGEIWGIDGTGTVSRRIGNFWINVENSPTLKQIDVSLSSSNSVQVCGVDSSGEAWVYDGSTWKQMVRPYGVSYSVKFVSVEAGIENVWATFSDGSLYHGVFY